MKKTIFEERASLLQKVFLIAADAIKRSSALSESDKARLLNNVSSDLELLKLAEKQNRNLASLKVFEKEFFDYWNEARGEHIEDFWASIESYQLPYSRERVLDKILKKKKVSNDYECSIITDHILLLQQEERISQKEILELNQMLADYEHRKQ